VDKKFSTFLEVAEALNRHGIVPTLYGSLGLYRLISPLNEISDIDIVVPTIYVKEKFGELLNIMNSIGYLQDAVFPHEFTKGEGQIGFEPEDDFRDYEGVDSAKFKTTKVGGAEFRELNPQDYLTIYRGDLKIKEKKMKSVKMKVEVLEKLIADEK
jgi:hypothetical protein